MDLPNLLNKFKSNQEDAKKFIAIEIGFDAVKTAIWQSTGAHTEVVSIGSIQSWSTTETDDLITAIDTSLADAETDPVDEPDQVIFGLPELWVNDDGIVESKKTLLKTICKKLNLKAIGFVVTTEAMVTNLRDVEGSPPSAILLQIATTEIAVSLIYLGKLETTQVVGRSTNIASDVEEGLARIPHSGHLPSRIIVLTNLDDEEPLKQELISYDWQKKLEFLHFPKVESLSKDWSIKSIAVTGGAEVIASLGYTNVPKSVTQTPIEQSSSSDTPNDLGFKSVDFNTLEKPITSIDNQELDNLEPVEENMIEPEPKIRPVKSTPIKLLLGFGTRVKSLVIKPKTESPKTIKMNTKKWIVPAIVLVVVSALIGGGVFAFYNIPEAKIDVFVALNPYQQQLAFTIDPTSQEGDMETITVAGKKNNLDKSGAKTIATTATKTVGERAKGKVTIYNRTTASKTLPAGTILKSNKLQYTLDNSITIASASAETVPPFSINPAVQEATITSSDIGEQYNVPKDTQFSVANFSNDNFVAVASNTLTGGSAQKVAAVSQEDIDSLKEELIKELQTQISESLSTSSEDDGYRQILIDTPQIVSEKYSATKGAEASELTLELTISQLTYQYNLAELSLIAQQIAASSLPPDVQLTPNNTEINILSTAVKEDGKAEVTAQIMLQYIPRIETDQYVKELTMSPIAELEGKLRTIPNFQSVSVEGKHLLFGRLPAAQDRITMHIKPVRNTE